MKTNSTVAFQMDALESIHIETDTSFALALEAQKRGFDLFIYEPRHLSYQEGILKAKGRFVTLQDQKEKFFTVRAQKDINLSTVQYLFVRQNPPYDSTYLSNLHLLELLKDRVEIFNDPEGIRHAPEKLLVTHFQEWTPPTLITQDISEAQAFLNRHGVVVLKPLFDYGGRGVFKITQQDGNFHNLLELFQRTYPEPFIVQKFIATDGDKRIFMVNGKPAGVFKRIPPDHQVVSNMRIGGCAHPCDYSQRDLEICEKVGPVLKKLNIMLAGLDIMGDYLTEINVTSPTGLRVIDRLYDLDLAHHVWECILERKKR